MKQLSLPGRRPMHYESACTVLVAIVKEKPSSKRLSRS